MPMSAESSGDTINVYRDDNIVADSLEVIFFYKIYFLVVFYFEFINLIKQTKLEKTTQNKGRMPRSGLGNLNQIVGSLCVCTSDVHTDDEESEQARSQRTGWRQNSPRPTDKGMI